MVGRFVAAFQFLTVIPLFKAKRFTDGELAASMAAFPLVGAVVGLAMAGLHAAFLHRLPPMVEGTVLVALLAWATGGFHLDGLADTIDGLGGGYTPERSLEIMKDSRIGALGAIALISVLMIKVSAIGYLDPKVIFSALVATPAAARGAVIFLAFKAPYARAEGGLGKPYSEHLTLLTTLAALLFGAAFSLLLGWQGAAAFGVILLWCAVLKVYFRKRLNGITGDVLGFAEETGEAIFLVTLHLLF